MTTETTSKQGWETDETYYYQTMVNESISEAVIHAVAAVSDRSPIPRDNSNALPPLFETINPDALDEIFATGDEESQPTGLIEFDYCGYDVTVESTGLVTVTGEMRDDI